MHPLVNTELRMCNAGKSQDIKFILQHECVMSVLENMPAYCMH